MKNSIVLFVCIILISSCKKESIEKPKSIEELVLEFCKTDIKIKSISPSTIKYDSLLTVVFEVKNNHHYYKKELDQVYDFKQINDSTSKKWQASVHFDSENKYGANIRNNVIYILKENVDYKKDTIMNERFIVLSRMDQNKMHEYMGIE